MKAFFAAVMVCVAASVFLACATPALAEDEPAAGVVVTAAGPVSVLRTGRSLHVRPGFTLLPGDSLVIKQSGSCEGFSPVGELFDRDGPALIVFAPAAEDNFRSRVSRWVARQLAQWVGQSRNQPLITRSGERWDLSAPAVKTLLPANGGRVRAGRAYLRWQAVDGVDRYGLTIASEDGAEVSSTVDGHEYSPPALDPGHTYAWRLRLDLKGTPLDSRWSEFRVMTAEEEADLDASLDGLPDLMAGVVLLSAGLHGEAIERLSAAVEHADDPGVARRWRARALAEAGMHERAYADLMEAMDED